MVKEHTALKMTASGSARILPSKGILQRACACGQHTGRGGEYSECNKKRLQRKTLNQPETLSAPPIVHEVLRSPGKSLDNATRAFMEPRFAHDFSLVRVHTDSRAVESVRAVNALAYTVGRDVIFGERQFAPHMDTGRELLAHELTHVIQQQNGMAGLQPRSRLAVGPVNDIYEREADRVAGSVVSDNSPTIPWFSSATTHLQRACGAAAIGSVGGCIGVGGQDITDVGISGSDIYRFNVSCDTFQPGEEERLRSFAGTIAGNETVEIHGFASEEGDLTFNDNLSCARAHAARSILLQEGVSVQIILIQHGATSGIREDRRSVVINVQSPPVTCGPDATNWFVRQIAAAKTDPDVLDVRSKLRLAHSLSRLSGISSADIAEGGITQKVLDAESRAGSPPRTPEAQAQLQAAGPSQIAFIRAGLEAIRDPIGNANLAMALLSIRDAALTWKRLVGTGRKFDFKNRSETLGNPQSTSCPVSCGNSITLCFSSGPECYIKDVPGNFFYAHIGRFVGWTELALQLGSQFAQLDASARWDPPEDTRMISIGFSLPDPLSISNLCTILSSNRSSFVLQNCQNCAEEIRSSIV